MEISLAGAFGTAVTGNAFNHMGFYPGLATIELERGSNRSVTGNSEINCGTNTTGRVAITNDGEKKCGRPGTTAIGVNRNQTKRRTWKIQAYGSETPRSNDVDQGNTYGCIQSVAGRKLMIDNRASSTVRNFN